MVRQRVALIPAAYILLRRGEEILFLKRHNTGYMDGKWGLPSGHIDDFEKPTVAAIRETKEEVGAKIDPKNLQFAAICYRPAVENDHERVHFVFECRKWSGEIKNLEPNKHNDMQWFAQDKPPKDLVPEVKLILEQLQKHPIIIED